MAIFATPNPRFGPFGSKAITHGLVDGDLPGGEIEPKGGQKRGIYIENIFHTYWTKRHALSILSIAH